MNYRGIDALKALDPGGIRLARGVHWLLVVVASGFSCFLVATYFAIGQPQQFAIMGAAVSLNAFIFSAPGTRRSETLEFLKNFGIALGVFALAAVVGWGDLGYGNVPAEIAWAFVIAAGLYLRRYGPAATQYGLMATLTFMFMILVNPTRDAALWLLPVVVIAGVTTLVVHNLIWRPSAMATYKRQVGRFLSIGASDLAACRHATAGAPRDRAHHAWDELARAGQLAVAEQPQERQRLQAMNASGLRFLMSLRVVKDASKISDVDPPNASERLDFDRLFTDVQEILTASDDMAASLLGDGEAALRKTRDDLIADRTLLRRDKFHWIRQVIGLMRVITTGKILRQTRDGIGMPMGEDDVPVAPAPARLDDRRGLGWRLAAQGFIASGITIAIGMVFDLSHAYWATMTVFVVLSASLGATIKRTVERAVGTSIGVLIAVGLQPLVGDNLIVQIILAALVTIPIFALIERHYMIAAGLIGFLVVMVLHMIEGVGVDGMLARLYQTAIGASLALLAAWLIFPIRAVDHIRPLVQKLIDDSGKALTSAVASDAVPDVSLTQLNSDSATVAAELVGFNAERLMMRHRDLSIAHVQAYTDNLAGYLALFLTTLRTLKNSDVREDVRGLETELVARLSAVLSQGLEPGQNALDINDLFERWQGVVPLDGSVPAHEAVLMIEEIYYARKVVQTLSGLRVALTRLHV